MILFSLLRHPELVSGPISPYAAPEQAARSMLKQVQHDAIGFGAECEA